MKIRKKEIIGIFLIVICIALSIFFFYKVISMKRIIGIDFKNKMALPSNYSTMNTKVGTATPFATNLSDSVNQLNVSKWKSGGNFNGTSYTTLTFPSAGMYLLVTGHNSTSGCNTMWIIQVATTLTTPRYTLIAKGGTSKVELADGTVYNQLKGKTTDGSTVNVYYVFLGSNF